MSSAEEEVKEETTDLAMLLRSEREKEQEGQVHAPEAPVSDTQYSMLTILLPLKNF